MTKRILSGVLALTFFLALIPATGLTFGASIISSGICGPKATWTLDNSGTFKVSGTGPMYDYDSWDGPPWDHNIEIHNNTRSLIIENGITHIGEYAFQGLTLLKRIQLPNSVISIGRGAFQDCEQLTEIQIPINVASIGRCAFSSCEDLTSIVVASGNQHYKSVGGALYDSTGSTLLQVPSNTGTVFAIPNGVKQVATDAFIECDNITEIILPDSLQII